MLAVRCLDVRVSRYLCMLRQLLASSIPSVLPVLVSAACDTWHAARGRRHVTIPRGVCHLTVDRE